MSSSNAMRQLEERHVASKVELMVWCNKMDLLALSNVRGEVALHRLSWQKVWTLAPPSEGTTVTGMAWRPDGKVIAIAYSTSELLLVDVENKETLHRTTTEAGVTCLAWVRDRGTEPKPKETKYPGTEPAGSFLPRLPSLSRSFGSAGKSADEDLEDAKRVRDQTSLNILLVGLASGVLHLLVFGLLPCGRVDLATRCVGRAGSVVAADVTDDLATLLVALSSPTDSGQELTLVMLDTSAVSSRAAALHQLASKHGLLSGLLGYLALTMRALSEAWENVLLEMDAKLAAYAAKVAPGSVSADFLELLMLGTPSPELETFLLQDLTEKGLKKLGHTIELSYSNIQKLVLKHLHSVGQSLTYHLAVIRGMSRWTDRFQPLGLEEAAVDSAIRATGAFLAKATEVQQVIDVSMKNYKAFFRWLYVVILRLTDERVPPEVTKVTQQDLAFIADFLLHFDGLAPPIEAPPPAAEGEAATAPATPPRLKFNLELLGQYLQDEPLSTPAVAGLDPWPRFLSANPALAAHPSITPHHPLASLANQHAALADAVAAVFAKPDDVIGSQFKVGQVMDCLRTSDVGPRPIVTHLLAQDGRLSLAFLDTAPPAEGFFFLRVAPEGTDYECAYFHFQAPLTGEAHPVLDVAFYGTETLSVLLSAGASRAAIFAQVPTRVLIAQSRPVALNNAPRVEAAAILEVGAMRPVDNMVASRFAVSGSRKVAVVLSESGQKVRLFEMEVEEEEEEDDTMDTTNSTARDSDQSVADTPK